MSQNGGHTHQLLSAAGIGMWVQDPAGRILHANDAMARLWGTTAEHLFDRHPWDFVESDSQGALTALLSAPRQGGAGVEIEWSGTLGTSWSSLVYVTYMSGAPGAGGRISAVVVDVSAHRPSWRHLRDTIGNLARISADLHQPAPAGPAFNETTLGMLSPRERVIITDLAEGRDIPEIVGSRHISENTVRNHIKNAYKKLGVHSRVQLFGALRP